MLRVKETSSFIIPFHHLFIHLSRTNPFISLAFYECLSIHHYSNKPPYASMFKLRPTLIKRYPLIIFPSIYYDLTHY